MPTNSRIVLITGANAGIGYATAKVLASFSTDYHIIIAARNAEKGATALASLRSNPDIKGTLSLLIVDVTDYSSVITASQQVEAEFGRIDALINNAGVSFRSENVALELENNFQTNVAGAAAMTQAFLPLLLKSQKPYLLYISSSVGSLTIFENAPNFEYSSYAATKAAVNMLTLAHHDQYKKQGIKVFAVCPGLVETDMRGTSEEARTYGGLAGKPEESGRLMLSVLEGERDLDVGKFIHKDGVYPW